MPAIACWMWLDTSSHERVIPIDVGVQPRGMRQVTSPYSGMAGVK